jgi:hypothetical protein
MLDEKTTQARANAVDTDVERDTYFLKILAEHRRAGAAKEGRQDVGGFRQEALGDKILDILRFTKQRGLDSELRRLHPSRSKRCSDDLDTKCAQAGITMEHIGMTIGTVLHGPDLSKQQPPHVVDVVRQALLERKVIFFRDQKLTREEHMAFAARFGSLEVHPFSPPLPGYPEVLGINHGAKSPGERQTRSSALSLTSLPVL